MTMIKKVVPLMEIRLKWCDDLVCYHPDNDACQSQPIVSSMQTFSDIDGDYYYDDDVLVVVVVAGGCLKMMKKLSSWY